MWRELAAAQSRYGTGRHGARRAVLGRPSVLMTPQAFVKRPVEWLRALTRHHGSVSFAPNFALRPVRPPREGSGRPRSVVLACGRLRRRADSPADARRVRGEIRRGRLSRNKLSCHPTVSPSTCSRRRCRRAAGVRGRRRLARALIDSALPCRRWQRRIGLVGQLRLAVARTPAFSSRTTMDIRCPTATSAKSCSRARR